MNSQSDPIIHKSRPVEKMGLTVENLWKMRKASFFKFSSIFKTPSYEATEDLFLKKFIWFDLSTKQKIKRSSGIDVLRWLEQLTETEVQNIFGKFYQTEIGSNHFVISFENENIKNTCVQIELCPDVPVISGNCKEKLYKIKLKFFLLAIKEEDTHSEVAEKFGAHSQIVVNLLTSFVNSKPSELNAGHIFRALKNMSLRDQLNLFGDELEKPISNLTFPLVDMEKSDEGLMMVPRLSQHKQKRIRINTDYARSTTTADTSASNDNANAEVSKPIAKKGRLVAFSDLFQPPVNTTTPAASDSPDATKGKIDVRALLN